MNWKRHKRAEIRTRSRRSGSEKHSPVSRNAGQPCMNGIFLCFKLFFGSLKALPHTLWQSSVTPQQQGSARTHTHTLCVHTVQRLINPNADCSDWTKHHSSFNSSNGNKNSLSLLWKLILDDLYLIWLFPHSLPKRTIFIPLTSTQKLWAGPHTLNVAYSRCDVHKVEIKWIKWHLVATQTGLPIEISRSLMFTCYRSCLTDFRTEVNLLKSRITFIALLCTRIL